MPKHPALLPKEGSVDNRKFSPRPGSQSSRRDYLGNGETRFIASLNRLNLFPEFTKQCLASLTSMSLLKHGA